MAIDLKRVCNQLHKTTLSGCSEKHLQIYSTSIIGSTMEQMGEIENIYKIKNESFLKSKGWLVEVLSNREKKFF